MSLNGGPGTLAVNQTFPNEPRRTGTGRGRKSSDNGRQARMGCCQDVIPSKSSEKEPFVRNVSIVKGQQENVSKNRCSVSSVFPWTEFGNCYEPVRNFLPE